MKRTVLKGICNFGVFVPLFSLTLCTPMRAGADTGPVKDIKQIEKLAEQGSIRDEIALAGDYFVGDGVPQDAKMAAFWYEKAAGHGNPEAQNQIGYFYQAGIGVPKDAKRAVHWYRLASSSGYSQAKINLAIAYLHGVDGPEDDDLAFQLLTQAFRAGNGTAATYLGLLHYFGIGVKQDKALGEKWFESALKLHDPLAAYNLGSLYSVNSDHAKDLPKAADLLRQSAEAGYVPAMHSLGLLLVNHPELKQEPQQSRTLLEVAANAGSWRSSVVLGILARDGRGTAIDNKDAYFHFRVAMLQGGSEADHLLNKETEKLASKIEDGERQTVETAAQAWVGHHSVALAFVYKDGVKRDFPAAAMALASDGSLAGQLIPLSSS
jgi:TPR repeat protein